MLQEAEAQTITVEIPKGFLAAMIRLEPEFDKITCSASNDVTGAFRGEISATGHGNLPTMAFNGVYLREILNAFDSKIVTIGLLGPLLPAKIVAGDSLNNDNSYMVLMPIRQ